MLHSLLLFGQDFVDENRWWTLVHVAVGIQCLSFPQCRSLWSCCTGTTGCMLRGCERESHWGEHWVLVPSHALKDWCCSHFSQLMSSCTRCPCPPIWWWSGGTFLSCPSSSDEVRERNPNCMFEHKLYHLLSLKAIASLVTYAIVWLYTSTSPASCAQLCLAEAFTVATISSKLLTLSFLNLCFSRLNP